VTLLAGASRTRQRSLTRSLTRPAQPEEHIRRHKHKHKNGRSRSGEQDGAKVSFSTQTNARASAVRALAQAGLLAGAARMWPPPRKTIGLPVCTGRRRQCESALLCWLAGGLLSPSSRRSNALDRRRALTRRLRTAAIRASAIASSHVTSNRAELANGLGRLSALARLAHAKSVILLSLCTLSLVRSLALPTCCADSAC
jgi:hypothetical protein